MIGPRAGETHASLVAKHPVEGDFSVSAELAFDDRMAPAILLAPNLHDAGTTKEYRSHIQVVLFDKGINVWHGLWKEGKFAWSKIGHARFTVLPKNKHKLKVTRKSQSLTITVDGQHEFGFITDRVSDRTLVGLIGCEGVNRFYSMTVVEERAEVGCGQVAAFAEE